MNQKRPLLSQKKEVYCRCRATLKSPEKDKDLWTEARLLSLIIPSLQILVSELFWNWLIKSYKYGSQVDLVTKL